MPLSGSQSHRKLTDGAPTCPRIVHSFVSPAITSLKRKLEKDTCYDPCTGRKEGQGVRSQVSGYHQSKALSDTVFAPTCWSFQRLPLIRFACRYTQSSLPSPTEPRGTFQEKPPYTPIVIHNGASVHACTRLVPSLCLSSNPCSLSQR